MRFAKIGAGLYVLWGLLHVGAAYDEFILGAEQSGLVQGKLYQGAWNLLFLPWPPSSSPSNTIGTTAVWATGSI